MPLPPRDFTDYHAGAGVRPDILTLFPLARFVPPSPLLFLQQLRDSGNPLAMFLSQQSWITLACMDEPSGNQVIGRAMQFAHTGDTGVINQALCGAAAPLFGNTHIPVAVMPVAPKFAEDDARLSSCPPTPPGEPGVSAAAPPTPAPSPSESPRAAPAAAPAEVVNAKTFSHGSLALLNAMSDSIRCSSGRVTPDTFRAVLPYLESMGAGLAAKAVREFQRTPGWRAAPVPVLRAVLCKYC